MLPAASYRIHWVEIRVSFDELLELFLGAAQGIFQARPETIMIDGQGRGHCIFFEADFSGATNANCRQLGYIGLSHASPVVLACLSLLGAVRARWRLKAAMVAQRVLCSQRALADVAENNT